MQLDLCYYGNPVLRKKAARVDEINDDVRQLIANMIETLEAHQAWGLAAPQVGVLLRIFVTPVDSEDAEGTITLCQPPKVYINPVISKPSEMVSEMNEGCLSLPGLSVPVIRPQTIDIEALDLEGNIFRETLSGFLARNRLHENDHLNGVLTIDRCKGKRRSLLDPQLRRIKQKYS